MTVSPDDLLSLPEAAAALDVSEETLRRWCRSRRIRHVRMPSGTFRFKRADVDAILTPVEPVVAS